MRVNNSRLLALPDNLSWSDIEWGEKLVLMVFQTALLDHHTPALLPVGVINFQTHVELRNVSLGNHL